MRWFRGFEAHRRSLLKSVTWRTMASLDTFVVSFIITGRIVLAGSIAGAEFMTKIILYYLHERESGRSLRTGSDRMNDDVDGQEEVLAFLGDPASHGGAKVRRIDTHAASVFLAGERALKIKRAVRFPFLDYSTLGKRKQACEAELAVNAPYAPEIYRRVIPITREADGRLAIAGNGAPVEWAVEMRRFDESRTLDHLAGEIDEALADALGHAVAAAHARAQPVEAGPVDRSRRLLHRRACRGVPAASGDFCPRRDRRPRPRQPRRL